MALTDILIVLAVFGGFGYMILARMYRQNPERTKRLIEWFTKTKDKMEDIKKMKEENKQIYVEKREIL